MTKRRLIAFIVGSLLATVARNEAVREIGKDILRSVPRLHFHSLSLSQPRAVLMDGELPICSTAIKGDTLYTARHCVQAIGLKEGDEAEVLLQKGEKPTLQKVYLRKVYGDIAILSFSPVSKTDESPDRVKPDGVKVEAGAKVVAVMGCLLANDPDVYRTSLPYFEREGKIIAVFTAKEIGLTEIDPAIPPTAEFALIDVGSFGGTSGSGVYLIDSKGKRHLIGVVSAGISDYTAVALL
jgi:hypothetical protein